MDRAAVLDDELAWSREKRTGDSGNVELIHKLKADDDADVRVVDESGCGEDCRTTLRLER